MKIVSISGGGDGEGVVVMYVVMSGVNDKAAGEGTRFGGEAAVVGVVGGIWGR